jgi:hypothetical protein
MSEIEEVEESVPVRHLSGGDAAVAIALLLFIIGWVGGWMWELAVDPPGQGDQGMGCRVPVALICRSSHLGGQHDRPHRREEGLM